MGKSLKGRECGKGICQRKDGFYSARFVDRTGKRHTKYFKTLPEAKNWMEDARYADKHDGLFVATSTTVDAWFNFWIENIVGDLAPNTLRNYRDRYTRNIKPVIGHMCLSDVKPMHCKRVLLLMDADYSGSSIKQTYITMGTLFKSAKMNDLITKHPMDGVRYTKPCRAADDIHFLTRDEQRRFLDAARGTKNYHQYAFLLETGLRTGEMIGLTWDAVDLEKRTLTVNKTLEYRYDLHTWRAGPPKTPDSYRTIPLTHRAVEILEECLAEREGKKLPPPSRRSSPIWTGAGARRPICICVILSLSTGVPGNRRRTVPMIPTYTGSVIRRASSISACTPCATPTPHEPSKAACSRKFCRSCWATPASRRPWTATFTSPRSRWTRLCGNLKPTVLRNPGLLKKWCKNGTVPKGPDPQTVANTGFFKVRYVYMKLGIVGDSTDPISQYYSINTDNS